jgi:hypothetical protein
MKPVPKLAHLPLARSLFLPLPTDESPVTAFTSCNFFKDSCCHGHRRRCWLANRLDRRCHFIKSQRKSLYDFWGLDAARNCTSVWLHAWEAMVLLNVVSFDVRDNEELRQLERDSPSHFPNEPCCYWGRHFSMSSVRLFGHYRHATNSRNYELEEFQ